MIQPLRDARTQQSIFYAVHQRMTEISAVDPVDNCNKHTLVHHITRSNDNSNPPYVYVLPNDPNIFHRIARMRATSRHPIARRMMLSVFFMSYPDERVTMTTFVTSIARERSKTSNVKIDGINQRMIIPL